MSKSLLLIGTAVALLLLLLQLGRVVAGSSRPPFLAHVTDGDALMRSAIELAASRHRAAVQQALANYPTDKIVVAGSSSSKQEKVPLAEYKIATSNRLPDFGNELPSAVYVTTNQFLEADECARVIAMAEDYFQNQHNGQWTRQKSGQYHVLGFYIRQIPAVHEWFVRMVRRKLFPLLCQQFPDFCTSPDDLCVDNAYLFKYTPETGRRTEIHTDSGCLSFTIALNGRNEYTGGGTWFQGLQNSSISNNTEDDGGVVEMDVGQVTVRPGGVKHCGYPVTSGTRYIIGGFCMHKHKPETVRMLLSGDPNDDDALPAFEAAVALNPDCDAGYNLLANQYEKSGDTAKAQQVLEYCLENVHGNSGEVAYSLGSLYIQQRLHRKAMQCFKICLQIDEADVDAMMGMAQCASALGDTATEKLYCEKIVETPGAADSIVASAYNNLGVLHQGEASEVEYYRKSLELEPDSFTARYSLACALASQEHWEEAVSSFKQAIKLLNENDNDGNDDNMIKALKSLYAAAMHLIRSQSQDDQPQSQQEMMKRFQDVMGSDNFSKLASLTRR